MNAHRIRNFIIAIVLAVFSPVFLVLAVAAIATFGVVGLWLLITDKE